MYINTQLIFNKINFDNMLNALLNDPIRGTHNNLEYKTILILSLITGLNMKLIINLKWGDILNLGSENEALVKDELIFRKYFIPIHPVVKTKISEIYSGLHYPNLDSLIVDVPQYKTLTPSQYVQRISSLGIKLSLSSHVSYELYKEINGDIITQILFGKKVFEVNGYSNEVCKKLKQHFEFRFNKELFDFLGINSKEEIRYEIHNINLNYNGGIVNLDQKNFNNGYAFQKFSAFSKFLFSKKNISSEPIIESVIILLLISINNGIRLSKLLSLKWDKVIDYSEEKKLINVRKYVLFDKQIIHLDREIGKRFLSLFNYEKEPDVDNLFLNSLRYDLKPNLNKNVFIMNSGNPITQPSLLREIKNVLRKIDFPYSDKIKTKSTLIIYGRRIIEIKGDHKPTIKKLIEHFNFRSKKQLFNFLEIDYKKSNDTYSFKGKVRNTIFDDILYDY